MADRGHELTDDILEDLEKRLKEEYEIAAREMAEKYREYMEKYTREEAVQRALRDAGKITEKDYRDWVYRHTMMGKRWSDMRDVLAADMHRTNEIARAMAEGRMPDVLALNANYGTYMIEHGGRIDTGFTLYDPDTVKYIVEEHQLMPGPSTKKAKEIAANKDMQWNARKIQSAVLQGILQGESAYEIAERLTGVAQMNYNAAVRYARTMTTNAENAGRYASFYRAKDLGVKLTIEWSATLDGRTRHEHRMMHGQRREVGEPFVVDGIKIMWPAQSSGEGAEEIPQQMIWNCRCTLLSWVKGFEGDTVKSSPKMGKMIFEEWQVAKKPKEKNVASKATTTAKASSTITRDYESQMAKAVGKDYYDSVCDMLDACENANVRELYAMHLNGVPVGSTTAKGAYELRGTIYFDTGSTAADTPKRKKHSTFFHESGHAVDCRISREDGQFLYYSTYWQNGRFNQTILSEVDEWVKSVDKTLKAEFKANRGDICWLKTNGFLSDFAEAQLRQYCSEYGAELSDILSGKHKVTNWFYKSYVPSYSKQRAYAQVEQEIRGIIRSDGGNYKAHALSDIVEGATKGRVQAGWGHGKSYWTDHDPSTEAFAEMCEAYVSGPESLETLKKYLPRSLASFDEMIAEYMGRKR